MNSIKEGLHISWDTSRAICQQMGNDVYDQTFQAYPDPMREEAIIGLLERAVG